VVIGLIEVIISDWDVFKEVMKACNLKTVHKRFPNLVLQCTDKEIVLTHWQPKYYHGKSAKTILLGRTLREPKQRKDEEWREYSARKDRYIDKKLEEAIKELVETYGFIRGRIRVLEVAE